jgi:hypothetical protein
MKTSAVPASFANVELDLFYSRQVQAEFAKLESWWNDRVPVSARVRWVLRGKNLKGNSVMEMHEAAGA